MSVHTIISEFELRIVQLKLSLRTVLKLKEA